MMLLKDYLEAIERAKTYAWLPTDAEKYSMQYPDVFPQMGVQVYKRYQEYLAACNAMDFLTYL